jgi:hypothetical protein
MDLLMLVAFVLLGSNSQGLINPEHGKDAKVDYRKMMEQKT